MYLVLNFEVLVIHFHHIEYSPFDAILENISNMNSKLGKLVGFIP